MKKITSALSRPFIWTYNKTHWFTDQDAWGLFLFFARLHTVGWILVVMALFYGAAGLPEAPSVAMFFRSLLGISLVLYFIFISIGSRSMEWKAGRMVVAFVSGIVPFGSFVFERSMTHYRKQHPPKVVPPVGSNE